MKAKRLAHARAIAAIARVPVLDEDAVPAAGSGGIATVVGSAEWEAAVGAHHLDALGLGVVVELGAEDGLGRIAVLDPVDEAVDDVALAGGAWAGLTDFPGTLARDAADAAVGLSGDTEEAEEVVEFLVAETHCVGDTDVVALGEETRDGGVGHTVVHEELGAGGLKVKEVGVEGRDVTVGSVEAVGSLEVVIGEVERVPGVVVKDGVPEPVLNDGLDRARELT